MELVPVVFRRRYRELSERDVSLSLHPHGGVLVMAGADAPAPISRGGATPIAHPTTAKGDSRCAPR